MCRLSPPPETIYSLWERPSAHHAPKVPWKGRCIEQRADNGAAFVRRHELERLFPPDERLRVDDEILIISPVPQCVVKMCYTRADAFVLLMENHGNDVVGRVRAVRAEVAALITEYAQCPHAALENKNGGSVCPP